MTQSLSIKGTLFAGEMSQPYPVHLIVDSVTSRDVLVGLEDGSTIPTSIRSISDRLGQTERRIELNDDSVFLTSDNDAVDLLSAAKGGWFSQVSSLEAFRPRLIAFVVASILLIAGAIRYGLPVAAKVAVWATPDTAVTLIDSSTLSTFDRIVLGESGLAEDRQKVLLSAFDELAIAAETKESTRLLFRDGGRIGPNAFALPGGTVVLTDQLAEILTDDEVIAVFAHELAHVKHNHGLQQMYRAFGFAAIVTVIAGDMSLVLEEILGGGGLLVAMAASREMEFEADSEGVDLLRKVGRDPANLKTALDTLMEKTCPKNLAELCEETGWFSSHPGSIERTKALEEAIAQ